MAKVEKFSRIIIKSTDQNGLSGTTAPSSDHTILPPWRSTDLYPGEFFINLVDEKLWIRTNYSIKEIGFNTNSLSSLSDVYVTSLTENQILKYSGGTWINSPDDTVTEMIWDKYDQKLTLETNSGSRILEIEGRPIDLLTGNTLLDKGFYTVLCNSGITLTLPPASGYTDDSYYGTIFKIKLIQSGITSIICDISNYIFDDIIFTYTSSPYELSTLGKTITLQSDGVSVWYII